jgi:hypothetical protein
MPSHIGYPKVANPALYRLIQPTYSRLHAPCIASRCNHPHLVLKPLQRFRVYPHPCSLFLTVKGKSKKFPPLRIVHRALLPVDLELQPLFYEPADPGHHPLSCTHASDIDVPVIGVTTEPVSASFKFFVKFVKQFDTLSPLSPFATRNQSIPCDPLRKQTSQPLLGYKAGVDFEPPREKGEGETVLFSFPPRVLYQFVTTCRRLERHQGMVDSRYCRYSVMSSTF